MHPLSGNRLFGYYVDSSGDMIIYTRGVDRISTNVVDQGSNINNIVNYLEESTAFYLADQLWKGMEDKLSAYVNSNGRNANKVSEITYRPACTKIKNYIKGTSPISSLGCN